MPWCGSIELSARSAALQACRAAWGWHGERLAAAIVRAGADLRGEAVVVGRQRRRRRRRRELEAPARRSQHDRRVLARGAVRVVGRRGRRDAHHRIQHRHVFRRRHDRIEPQAVLPRGDVGVRAAPARSASAAGPRWAKPSCRRTRRRRAGRRTAAMSRPVGSKREPAGAALHGDRRHRANCEAEQPPDEDAEVRDGVPAERRRRPAACRRSGSTRRRPSATWRRRRRSAGRRSRRCGVQVSGADQPLGLVQQR